MILSALKVKLLDPRAKAPARAHVTDAGYDLFCLERHDLSSGEIAWVRTGVAVDIPEGYVGLIMDRSSMGRRGVKVYGGVVDAGYHGEVVAMLGLLPNNGAVVLEPGDKIAQLVVVPHASFMSVDVVENLPESARGEKGFGSTGVF